MDQTQTIRGDSDQKLSQWGRLNEVANRTHTLTLTSTAEGEMVLQHEEVRLRDPVMIAAFRGWNDAGEAATFAATHLARVWGGKKVASIDPEEFYDFQVARPHVELVDGVSRTITWPTNEFWAARLEGAERDALVLVGTEPNGRWRTFTRLIVEFAKEHNVQMVVTLGALLADVAHSRPVNITGTAGDRELIEKLGLERSRYEGPTGIVGVLHDALGGCADIFRQPVGRGAALPGHHAQPQGCARPGSADLRPDRPSGRRGSAGGRGQGLRRPRLRDG